MKIKNQSLQTDMLRQISSVLKVTACMDDEHMGRINEIVFQLDQLADDLEKCVGEDLMPAEQINPPNLTVV